MKRIVCKTLYTSRHNGGHIDPQGRPAGTAGSNQFFPTWCLYIRLSLLFKILQNKTNFKLELWSLLARLRVWPKVRVINDTCLVDPHGRSTVTRPDVITIFTHVVHPSPFFQVAQNKTIFKREKWSGLWVWPSGSLMTHMVSLRSQTPTTWYMTCDKTQLYFRKASTFTLFPQKALLAMWPNLEGCISC